MSRTTRIITGIVAAVVVIGALVLAYIYISSGSGEASTAISAPTIARGTASAVTDAPTAESTLEATPGSLLVTVEGTLAATNSIIPDASIATAASTEEAATADVVIVATNAPTENAATAEAISAATDAPTEEAAAQTETAGEIVFNIVPEESEVRFTIFEELRGQPVNVVGTTDQVAGQILVNFDDPAASQIGVIRINVRTLRTDSDFRDRAIRSAILQSAQDEFEFAEFTPTAVEGLPDTVTIGEPFTITITGDLTLRDITNPITFTATITPESTDRLVGTATASVQRTPFGLTIPNAPGVANVSEDVELAIDFTAAAAS